MNMHVTGGRRPAIHWQFYSKMLAIAMRHIFGALISLLGLSHQVWVSLIRPDLSDGKAL